MANVKPLQAALFIVASVFVLTAGSVGSHADTYPLNRTCSNKECTDKWSVNTPHTEWSANYFCKTGAVSGFSCSTGNVWITCEHSQASSSEMQCHCNSDKQKYTYTVHVSIECD